MRRLFLWGLGFTGGFNAQAGNSGSSVDLCHDAKLIVVGRVASKTSRWTHRQGERAIVSDVSLDIERNIIGPPYDSLQFTVRGGEVDGIGLISSGSPQFDVGVRYLLLLLPDPRFPQPIILEYSYLPATLVLPPDAVLRDLWKGECDAHPEGVSTLWDLWDGRTSGAPLVNPLRIPELIPNPYQKDPVTR